MALYRGKLEDRNVSIEKIAELLEIDVETINNKLTAKWVKEDSFVPIENYSESRRNRFNENTARRKDT